MNFFWKLIISSIIIIFSVFCPKPISEMHINFFWILNKNAKTPLYKMKDSFSLESYTNTFTFQKRLVYYNNSGHILFSTDYPSDLKITASISRMRYVRYFQSGHSIGIYEKNKRLRFYPSDSYPVISRDGESVLFVTGEGEGFRVLSLSNYFISAPVRMGYPLIDIQRGFKNFYVGLLNGSFIKIQPSNTNKPYIIIQNLKSGINIIKRISLSLDEKYVGYISGLYPEYIKIYDNQKNKIISKIKTGENKRKKTFLVFSPDDKLIAEETRLGFNIYSITGKKMAVFKDKFLKDKKQASFAFCSPHLYLMTASINHKSFLLAVNKNGKKIFSRTFSDAWLAIHQVTETEIILESPDRLLSLQIQKGGFYE